MEGSVLIVGAGPAGMRAASELVDQGFKVFLVETKPTIGGKMAQIDKMFPSNECSTCTISPRMLETASNPNIVIHAFSEVESIVGQPGDFKVTVLKKPRYVDPMKCNACTDCFAVCPVGGVPMEFNFGRGASKAISFYAPFPPRKALIHPDRCNYLLSGKCGEQEQPPCVQACKHEAIAFSQKPATVELRVGAVILATGADEVRTGLREEYGHGKLPDVLTALEYERLLSGLGPTGGVVKRQDGNEPKSVAWYVLDSATPIGIMTAVAEAQGTVEKNPQVAVSVLCQNTHIARQSYQDFYLKAREMNIEFIEVQSVAAAAGTAGTIDLSYRQNGKEQLLAGVEMFVLVPPLAVSDATQALAEKIGVQLHASGLFEKADGDTHPIHTSRPGIFVCGSTLEPKGIDDAVVQACAAASHAAALLGEARGKAMADPAQKVYFPVASEDEPSIAAFICRCGPNIAGLLNMDELVEYTASLPHVQHVEVSPFACDGVKIREVLGTREFNRVLIGGCSPKTHEEIFGAHTMGGGLNRYLMEIVNLRNQCTWVHATDKQTATEKAKTLMRMGAARVALQEPLEDIRIPVTRAALVVGGTPAGIACALKLVEGGFDVSLVAKESDLSAVPANQTKFVQRLLAELQKSPRAKLLLGASLQGVEGFIGNFKAEVVRAGGKEIIESGSIVIAAGEDMKAAEGDFEKDLFLQRDSRNFFTGMLGILNPFEFNTAGVFRCGPARMEMGLPDSIIDGEGAAARVAGVISKTELVKAPIISVVVDENCDGCAYCIEPCPAHALTLLEYTTHDGKIKKTVEVNEAVCLGCGNCMATCPKNAVYVRNFKPEQIMQMVHCIAEVA